MNGEYPGVWPNPENEKGKVIPFERASKPKPGSHAESMVLLGYGTITEAQRASYEMDPTSNEYKRLKRLISLAKLTARKESIGFEDLDIQRIQEEAARKKAA